MAGKRLIINELIMHDLSKFKLHFRGTIFFNMQSGGSFSVCSLIRACIHTKR